MAEHNLLYKKAQYYDVIFDRDVSKEVDFLLHLFKTHAGRDATSAIELACGPGYHCREMARRGLTSYGLDLNEAMIALARKKAAAEQVSVAWLEQDFRTFQLPAPVDLAYIVFDGFDALTDNNDIIAHLKMVSHNLTPDGLYIIDLSHPLDYSIREYGTVQFEGEKDGVHVRYTWGTNIPRFNLLTSTAEVEVTIEIDEHGEKKTFKDQAIERMLIPQEIIMLARLSGEFEVVDWYGEFDPAIKFDPTGRTRRMIAVLQKRGAADGQ